MPRPARVSPDRILAAAAAEFAARGFAGARVDHIARRARVNKAMLYYHFKSKQALYRLLLRRSFTLAAARVRAIADSIDPPPVKVDRMIAALAELMHEHDFLPAIMLREIAEGGAHLDRETLLTLMSVPRAVGEIVQQGIAQKCFRPIHPLVAHVTMLAPIVFYLAASPIREELGAMQLGGFHPPAPDAFVRHMQEVMRRTLALEPSMEPTR